jgi:Uma2 family endonuclease
LVNPKVIIEILSDSTEKYDRTTKFRHYQKLESLQEYILIDQHEAMCERYCRLDDGSWAVIEFLGLDAVLEVKSVPVKVPLKDLYNRVDLAPQIRN